MLSGLRFRWPLRSRLRRDDAGVTLTELVVTSTLVSIVGALAVTALVGTSRGTDRTTEAELATAGARNAMSAWTSLLQVAVVPDPVDPAARDLTVTPTSISFNAQLGSLPDCTDSCRSGAVTRVTLAFRAPANEPAQLVQTLTDATGPRTSIVVPANVGKPDSGCFFSAYRLTGTAYDCTTLTADQTVDVGRIDIAFTVQPPGAPRQSYTSSARLPGGAT